MTIEKSVNVLLSTACQNILLGNRNVFAENVLHSHSIALPFAEMLDFLEAFLKPPAIYSDTNMYIYKYYARV